MGMQSMSGAAARNQFKAASIPSKVSVGKPHATTVTAPAAPVAPGKGAKGFSGTGVMNGKVKV